MLPFLPLGGARLSTYALLFLLGAGLCLFTGLKRASARGMPLAPLLLLSLPVAVVSLAGAKLLYSLTESHVDLLSGGFVFHGGLLAGLAATFLAAPRLGLKPLLLLDAFAPGMALGQAAGRLGCFASGCCHGAPSNLPWAATFTDAAALAPLNVPLHPVQLYEVAFLFGVSVWLFRKSEGEFALYLGISGAFRFLVEFYRGDPRPMAGPLSLAQLISLGLIAAAIIVHRTRTGPHPKRTDR